MLQEIQFYPLRPPFIKLLHRRQIVFHQNRKVALLTSLNMVSLSPSLVLLPLLDMRLMNLRGEKIDDKIKKLDAELTRYREKIKKACPGPAQETIKARATRIHDQIIIYEGKHDALYSRAFKLDQVAFVAESFKDA